MCCAILSTGLLRHFIPRNDVVFLRLCRLRTDVLVATFVYRSVLFHSTCGVIASAARQSSKIRAAPTVHKIFIAAEHQRRRMRFALLVDGLL